MTLPKILIVFSVILFGVIGFAAYKKSGQKATQHTVKQATPVEVELGKEVYVVKESSPAPIHTTPSTASSKNQKSSAEPVKEVVVAPKHPETVPEADRIDELFFKNSKLPIVETIIYKSRVPWQKGRPAWLSDYASYYQTSRHFIARSLNGKPDYFKQELAEGDKFNVLKKDKDIQFYLVIDHSRSKLWFYYIDNDTNERVLLKTYPVSLGRKDSSKKSGILTPLGKYTLGSKIAIYKPKSMGTHNGQKTEMIRIFGTRWMPFDQELDGCTEPAKGFGIHGVPWIANEKNELVENRASLGKYESDGCIRLATEDVEEIFAIVITKPTIVELVRDFHDATLPGKE